MTDISFNQKIEEVQKSWGWVGFLNISENSKLPRLASADFQVMSFKTAMDFDYQMSSELLTHLNDVTIPHNSNLTILLCKRVLLNAPPEYDDN